MKKIDFSHEQYAPIEELGRGGMGVVYKCTDRKMLNDVAVKVIGWNPSNDEIIRFQKEAKALAKLQHPNILGIHHFGHSDDDSLFIVMELLTGRSLSSLIESEIVPPFEDALTIFIQICDGLSHAHRKDVLHRDVKPSNIFVQRTERGDIKTTITDFGLAKLLNEDQRQTKTGIALGSPAYISPEQASGKDVDERSDLYSVGCLMFEVLTGQKPFQATTVPALIMKQINEPPPRLSDVAADRNYPEEIEEIIAKCLKKDPDERYASATELRTDLQDLKDKGVVVYGQIENSSQSGSASRMDEFLMTGLQLTKPKHPLARKAALVAASLILTGVMAYLIVNMNTAPIDTSVSPEVKKMTISGSNESSDYGDMLLKEHVHSYHKSPPEWVQCRFKGGGVKLVDVANQARATKKAPGAWPYYIDCRDSDLNDEQLNTITFLELLGLRLDRTHITDESLKNSVNKITTLKELCISGTKITDAGIKNLTDLKDLGSINIAENTELTDESIATLSKMKSINFICAMFCPKITGSTFGALRKVRPSIGLSIGGSNINNENLKLLEGAPLIYLDAQRTDLTDKDLEVISKFETLTGLLLHGNHKITGTGLMKLSRLKKLVVLGIHDCPKIERSAISELKAQRPKLDIQLTEAVNDF